MEHDDVPDKVGVGLLPERFFAFAPDGDDDGGYIERLRVSIGIAVERVVANVTIKRHIDIFNTVVPVKCIFLPLFAGKDPIRKSLNAGPVCVPPFSHCPTT